MSGKKMSSSAKGRNSLPSTSSMLGVRTTQKTAPKSPGSPGIVIAHIKAHDNYKLLPRYSAALSRPHDDSMPAEDLDAIQLELELLLSTVSQRARALKSEYESLDREDKRDRKGKYIEKQPSSPSTKRKRDEKKFKDGAKYFGSQAKVARVKNASSHSRVVAQHTDDSMDSVPYFPTNYALRENPKLVMPKNDTPNKFWLSVEPYCMPISHEDIKLLDDLIEEYSGALVPPIPDLGPHYSSQWANEDLKDEQDNSNPNAKTNKRFTSGSSADVINMLKKGEKLIGESVTGPLTQRLVAALLEENVMPDDQSIDNVDISAENSTNNQTLSMLKNGINIERRVKKELIEQGLLDPEDFQKECEDEILTEIKKVRTELASIAEYNYEELKKLQKAAKDEIKRLEVKRKLDAVDQEIIEMYKKIGLIKQKRRPLTKQERDEVFRLTEEQKRISDQLEAMKVPGPSFMD
ncbi:transcriptional adapter 3 [Bradysia coprophila]|uniref:transcriptional adapter 3 n=1 Tax=Bradysia coprophila TaxID=38358 RepID=UPI00187DBF2C|nr:transcriptional adapter 3 [Bradysia coprophila]